MSKENRETAVAVMDNFRVPTLNNEITEIFKEEMQGLTLDFDRVRIPTGGLTSFEVPGETDDEPELVKELVGVIVDHHPVNAYWSGAEPGNNPPDCSSPDGIVSIDGRHCKDCNLNQWGTGKDGKGKACKNMHRIYLLREGDIFPLLLTLPPTSIRNFSSYMAKRVVGKGRRSYQVITKIALKKVQSSGNITYSQATFSIAGVLNQEASEQMRRVSENIKKHTRQIVVAEDEYINGNVEDDTPF